MIEQLNILAQDDSSTLKVIIGIVFAGIWIIAQILSSVGKKKEKPPQQADYPIDITPDTMPAPVPPRQQRPVKHRVETHQRQRAQQQQRRAETAAVPPPLVQTARQSQQQRRVDGPVAPVDPNSPILANAVGTKSSSRTAVTRADRLRALLRPGNLRKEYILTEVFQPPISQRPDRFD